MHMIKESRLYGKREFVSIINKATYSLIKHRKGLKKIDKKFRTNIMLAVTEVNGCKACSYFHTKHAIDSGIDELELKSLLSGDLENVKPEEALALLFAQHYASEKGNYSKETFQKIIDYYGQNQAYGILTTIRLISFGNAQGINLGNFGRRFTRKGSVKGSKVLNEIFIILSPAILMPITFIMNLFTKKESIRSI